MDNARCLRRFGVDYLDIAIVELARFRDLDDWNIMLWYSAFGRL